MYSWFTNRENKMNSEMLRGILAKNKSDIIESFDPMDKMQILSYKTHKKREKGRILTIGWGKVGPIGRDGTWHEPLLTFLLVAFELYGGEMAHAINYPPALLAPPSVGGRIVNKQIESENVIIEKLDGTAGLVTGRPDWNQ